MFRQFLSFIKYNNAAILILIAIFLIGGSVFATETGQEIIGERETRIEGIDNTLLLEADLDNLDMDFRIERLEETSEFYYVIYTFIDLTPINNSWQYLLREKERKISKKSNIDLGDFLAEELTEEYNYRVSELKKAQIEAFNNGEESRVEVVEYSGLIGKTLDITSKVFSGYEAVKKTTLPAPVNKLLLRDDEEIINSSPVEDLADVYEDFIEETDPDEDNVFYEDDNCPTIFNPSQLDTDSDGLGDACDIDNGVEDAAHEESDEVVVVDIDNGDESAENTSGEGDPGEEEESQEENPSTSSEQVVEEPVENNKPENTEASVEEQEEITTEEESTRDTPEKTNEVAETPEE